MRTALAAGAALIAASAAGALAPAAVADQTVVTATVYPGAQGSVTTEAVTLGGLGNCPPYAGGAPFLLQPSGQPYQPAQGSSWELATILSCGLQIPPAAVSDVQVESVQHGYEAPLSWGALSDPGQYHDPSAPGALPVISVDGTQAQVTYERPARGPSDRNGADGVVDPGPVTIAVYENAPPLTVHITSHQVSAGRAGARTSFAASASRPGGGAIAPGNLGFHWTFGDGTGSSAVRPGHTFPAGRYFVTVVVSDQAQGLGGTATVPVSVDSAALSGTANRGGAGANRSAGAPSGAVRGRGTAASPGRPSAPSQAATTPRSGGAPKSGPSSSPATAPPTTASTTPAAPTTDAATPSPSTASLPTPAAPAAHPAVAARDRAGVRHSPRRPPHRAGGPAARVRLVRGQLIADVAPVAAGAIPVVRPVAATVPGAAAVRAATQSTSLAGWLVGLAVLGLLGAGAGRELRGRRPAP